MASPDKAKWRKACYPCNEQLNERKPYLGAWARSSFEQGALCALAAMTSDQASYVALDAFFQCHGIGPCVCTPPRAVLPLVIHYYGNKDAIHELDAISYLPYLAQALFGHGTLPPLYEWKVASDFAVKCRQLPMLEWAAQQWASHPQASEPATDASPFAVLPMPSPIADGLPASLHADDITDPPIHGEVVHVYGTGLNGGLPHDLPSDHIDVTFHLRGAYRPCMSQMFAEQYSTEEGWRRLPLAPLRSDAEYLEFCRCLLDEAGEQ